MPDKYRPFLGDGRVTIAPAWHFPGTVPARLSYAQARAVIDRFLINGISSHSGDGGTLWVLLQWLQEQQIDYTLEAAPGYGYQVVRKNHRVGPSHS
jgi:hypothetical protein